MISVTWKRTYFLVIQIKRIYIVAKFHYTVTRYVYNVYECLNEIVRRRISTRYILYTVRVWRTMFENRHKQIVNDTNNKDWRSLKSS